MRIIERHECPGEEQALEAFNKILEKEGVTYLILRHGEGAEDKIREVLSVADNVSGMGEYKVVLIKDKTFLNYQPIVDMFGPDRNRALFVRTRKKKDPRYSKPYTLEEIGTTENMLEAFESI